MAKIQKIIGDVELNRDLVLLLLIGGLYSLSISLSNTFVNVYLWKQSGEFLDLGLYNLFSVIFQPLTFIIAGRWAKKMDRIIVLRLGVTFLSIFFMTVLAIGDLASQYIILLGSLIGIGYGFYWLAFNVLTFEITEPETRDFFNGFLGVLTSTAGIIGPILAGFIISRLENFKGYTVIFTISLLLFICSVVLSMLLKRREAKGDYILWEIYKERKRNRNWRYITNAHFFQGIREGTFVFIISVFVFIKTDSELALGTFGLINSIVAFFGYYLATRIITKKMRKKAILIGGLILYFSVYIIIFQLTYTNLLIYGILIGIAYPILLVPYVSMTYDVIGKGWNAAKARIEYIVIRELFLNFGRIVSILIFILVVQVYDAKEGIRFLLAVLGIGHTLIYPFVKRIKLQESNRTMKQEKQIRKPNLADGGNG